jgi:hypothetical protein
MYIYIYNSSIYLILAKRQFSEQLPSANFLQGAVEIQHDPKSSDIQPNGHSPDSVGRVQSYLTLNYIAQ